MSLLPKVNDLKLKSLNYFDDVNYQSGRYIADYDTPAN